MVITLALVYVLIICYVQSKLRYKSMHSSGDYPAVSIIIPFRNQAQVLAKLIRHLNALDYPKNKCEFIFIDDSSEDASLGVLKNGLLDFNYSYKTLSVQGDLSGKQHALFQGVNNCTYPYVLCLDADCFPKKNWIKTYVMYINKNFDLIYGHVIQEEKYGFFRVEYASILAMTNFFGHSDLHLMASGANMAFKKQFFLEYHQNANLSIKSGHDMFLLHWGREKGYAVAFNADKNAVVTSFGEEGVVKVFWQRLRWFKKNTNALFSSYGMASLFFGIVHSLIPITLVHSVFFPAYFSTAMVYGLAIGISDAMLLHKTSGLFQLKNTLDDIIKCYFLYPFYLFLLVLMAPWKAISWKGRKVDR